MDSRAVSPAVGKILAAGLVVLYVASVTGLVVGEVVPEYRTATGNELSDRVLATAATTVDRAVPATDSPTTARATVDLPGSIRGRTYRITIEDRRLVLDHPNENLDAATPLSLPANVTAGAGTWQSGRPLVVRVTGDATNRTVELERGSA